MNKVILMGRLTRDPETRYTQTNNTLVSSFSLAVNRRFVRQGEERQADFINIVAWSKLGEFCSKYFKKGQQVGVIGRIQTRTWDDDQGQKHYVTEVVAEEAYFADSKREGDFGGNSFDEDYNPRFRKQRKKVCLLCSDKNFELDYKNPEQLKKFINDKGKILPRRTTGACAKHQRDITLAVKRARHIALLPYAQK